MATGIDRDRIAPVDGLRAVAVLGVIWAHVWAYSGTPTLIVGSLGPIRLDLNRAVSVIGTGVDLFFVISGFCMYLMYSRAPVALSWRSYVDFLRKRWWRIAPAFYVAAVVAAVGFAVAGQGFPALDLAAHLAFLHIVVPGAGTLAAPFWSLATEWHFYMVLPPLVWGASRRRFWVTAWTSIVACVLFRLWMYAGPPALEDFWKVQLPSRLVEFVWGMCVARAHVEGKTLPRSLCGARGFVIAALVVYAGRLLMVSEVVRAAGPYGVICKVAAEPVMTAGYALLLWNVIGSPSWFRALLSRPASTAVGRWSYSLYLWHWWPAVFISRELAAQHGVHAWVQLAALGLCLAVLLPVAWLTYRVLELPYFQSRRRLELGAVERSSSPA